MRNGPSRTPDADFLQRETIEPSETLSQDEMTQRSPGGRILGRCRGMKGLLLAIVIAAALAIWSGNARAQDHVISEVVDPAASVTLHSTR